MMGMTLVYDGDAMYMPMVNSYSKFPLSGGSSSAGAGAMGGGMFGGETLARIQKSLLGRERCQGPPK